MFTQIKTNVALLALANLLALAGLLFFQYKLAPGAMPNEAFWLAIGVNLGSLATALANSTDSSGPPAWVGLLEKALDKIK